MRLGLVAAMLLVAGCSQVVNVDTTKEYKCGDKIVLAEYLDDESIILRINGTSTVLSRSVADSEERFDNSNSQMTFTKKDGDIYLSEKGKVYPMCLEIKR